MLEVDITPNRVDATSHFGVARDLAAYLKQNGKPANQRTSGVDAFKIDDEVSAIKLSLKIKKPVCAIQVLRLKM